jgi:lipase chaperone LimK
MPLWLSVSFAVCTVLALAGCVFLIFTTTPAALKRQITILRAEVQEVQVVVEAIGQRWVAYKAELETLADAVEDNLQTIEKKRRRVAARESREKRANGPEQPMSPEEHRLSLQRHARGMGFDV